jgi:hypothetical protein
VVPHLLGSLAHMLACVRACQLRAPNRVAFSSSTCERRTSGPLSPLANTPRSHVLVRCADAHDACTRALHRAARSSRLLPVPMCRLAPMRDTLHAQLDPHDAPPASPAAQHRAAHMAWLYALVHCNDAHPCLSCSTPVPLSLSAARPAVPPHMLISLLPARIPPACR